MRTTIVNVGTIVSGDWRQPLTDGDSVSMIDGRIDSVGVVSERSVRDSDAVSYTHLTLPTICSV